MSLHIDRTINNIENTLTGISAYPVVGTVAGCVKILMGAVQVVAAIAYGIFALIRAAMGDWSPLKYSWTHIKHGVGNMVAGTFEALPVVQTALYCIRKRRQHRDPNIAVYVAYYHEFKFMPYTSLAARDWRFMGVQHDVYAVNYRLRCLLEKEGINEDDQGTRERRGLELAPKIIKEWNVIKEWKADDSIMDLEPADHVIGD